MKFHFNFVKTKKNYFYYTFLFFFVHRIAQPLFKMWLKLHIIKDVTKGNHCPPAKIYRASKEVVPPWLYELTDLSWLRKNLIPINIRIFGAKSFGTLYFFRTKNSIFLQCVYFFKNGRSSHCGQTFLIIMLKFDTEKLLKYLNFEIPLP